MHDRNPPDNDPIHSWMGLGRRDPALRESIEKGAGDTDRIRQHRFAKAITAWKEESAPKVTAQPTSPAEDGP